MPSRWMRIWANVTVASTLVLLALGAVVSSFRVGMADPIWPTAPWQLALVDWSEPSHGFLIEHAHRLAGFTIGGLMVVLVLAVWWCESNRPLRRFGLLAVFALVVTFGYLHGVLIQQTKMQPPSAALTLPATTAAMLAVALTAILIAAICTAYCQTPGWHLRCFAIALLIGVMVQGLLGGLRVHLDAMFGRSLSIVHASFSQIVFGLTVLIATLASTPSFNQNGKSISILWPATAALAVYLQVTLGAIVRHLPTVWGPRLHLLFAFVGVVALLMSSLHLWRGKCARGWVLLTLSLLATELVLGVESWMVRFGNGMIASEFRRIDRLDALIRVAHSVGGYLLFGIAIGLAARTWKANQSVGVPVDMRTMEGVA